MVVRNIGQIIFLSLFFAQTAFAATFVCNSTAGKSAYVRIVSETLNDPKVYTRLIDIEFSEMEDVSLNGIAYQGYYTRVEANDRIPVALAKLSESFEENDYLKISFVTNDLKVAELSYFNPFSDISIDLSTLSCEEKKSTL